MTKIVAIPSCCFCAHKVFNGFHGHWTCTKKYKIIEDIGKIPTWCPLDDAPEKDNETVCEVDRLHNALAIDGYKICPGCNIPLQGVNHD